MDTIFGFFAVGAVILIFVALFSFFSRLSFMSKMGALCKLSDDPSWRVWRLSAVEPAVTTSVTGVWLFFFITTTANYPDWVYAHSTHLVIQTCILLFIARIWMVGERCRRGRLVISVLLLRFTILTAPLLVRLFGADPYHYDGLFDATLIGSILVAYTVRAIFGLYQNKVTPKANDFIRQQTEEEIYVGRREIEDNITLTDDVELWNEQVALIEQLKAQLVEG